MNSQQDKEGTGCLWFWSDIYAVFYTDCKNRYQYLPKHEFCPTCGNKILRVRTMENLDKFMNK